MCSVFVSQKRAVFSFLVYKDMFIISAEKAFCFSHLVWGAKKVVTRAIFGTVKRRYKKHAISALNMKYLFYFLFLVGRNELFPLLQLTPNN
jgi:hypothetical protein